ncbi:MAG TPA: ATPase [Sphingomicrobium sp.]
MRGLVVGTLLLFASPAAADVVTASENGFEIRQAVPLVVKPEIAFTAFANLPAWWNAKHTYSGKSENLSLELNPGGCFCERFPDGGGIEHMHVTYVDPGKRILMTGALGPLLYEATTGVMDVQIKSTPAGSLLTLDYRASGFFNGGAAKLAPIVDKVLADQMRRYRTYATARPRS